jgi:hypothetical protein
MLEELRLGALFSTFQFIFSPPDPESLKEAREKRLKEIKMNAALKEIFAFFFFLILLMDVAQYHRDPDTFLLTKTLSETFEELDAFGIDLSAVSCILRVCYIWHNFPSNIQAHA